MSKLTDNYLLVFDNNVNNTRNIFRMDISIWSCQNYPNNRIEILKRDIAIAYMKEWTIKINFNQDRADNGFCLLQLNKAQIVDIKLNRRLDKDKDIDRLINSEEYPWDKITLEYPFKKSKNSYVSDIN